MIQPTETTKLTSKGQLVIPKKIRKLLHLQTGSTFSVATDGTHIMLSPIQSPNLEDFRDLQLQAKKAAEAAGFQQENLMEIIGAVRAESRT